MEILLKMQLEVLANLEAELPVMDKFAKKLKRNSLRYCKKTSAYTAMQRSSQLMVLNDGIDEDVSLWRMWNDHFRFTSQYRKLIIRNQKLSIFMFADEFWS